MSKATKVVWAENWESLEKLGVRKEQRWKREATLHLYRSSEGSSASGPVAGSVTAA
jgi:hypothetical protein